MKITTSARELVGSLGYTLWFLGWMILLGLFLVMVALPALADDPTGGSIPEIMAPAPSPTAQPRPAGWVEEIQNSLQTYKASYPTSNFEPYLKTLGRVQDAAQRGDRRMVKTEMTGFFKMLARRSHGIDDVAADELTNFAQMVTPLEEYGIAVPRSGASQYDSEVLR